MVRESTIEDSEIEDDCGAVALQAVPSGRFPFPPT